MQKQTTLGANRTGIDMSPVHSKAMASGAQELTNVEPGPGEMRAQIEQAYLSEANLVGSVPVPGTLKGVFKSTMEKAAGINPEVFINKLGQRLAFERTGTRLYEAVMRKCRALETSGQTLPFTLEELDHNRSEELQHFHMLKECLQEIGADPTAMTPDADVSAVASMGYQRALTDPRTTVAQCLDLLLELELADLAGWEMLVRLAKDFGMDEMAQKFQQAQRQEDEHERKVRAWCMQAVKTEAGTPRKTKH